MYRPVQSLDDTRNFLICEEYADEGALASHWDSEHFKRYALEQAISLLKTRDRTYYVSVGQQE